MNDQWEIAPGRVLSVVEGDITKIPADAIVDAANAALAGGGGVDGAIHRAGGAAIMDDLEARYGPYGVRRCPAGSAVVTVAGRLPARWVIHAVGPFWEGGASGEAEVLASAYAASMRVADEVGAKSVTFPAISTGVYGYPADQAAAVAVRTLAEALASARTVRRVTLVAHGRESATVLAGALRREMSARRG